MFPAGHLNKIVHDSQLLYQNCDRLLESFCNRSSGKKSVHFHLRRIFWHLLPCLVTGQIRSHEHLLEVFYSSTVLQFHILVLILRLFLLSLTAHRSSQTMAVGFVNISDEVRCGYRGWMHSCIVLLILFPDWLREEDSSSVSSRFSLHCPSFVPSLLRIVLPVSGVPSFFAQDIAVN